MKFDKREKTIGTNTTSALKSRMLKTKSPAQKLMQYPHSNIFFRNEEHERNRRGPSRISESTRISVMASVAIIAISHFMRAIPISRLILLAYSHPLERQDALLPSIPALDF